MNGDVDTMHELVKHGADVNARGVFGTPALHWRVRVDDLAGAKFLLHSGADANGTTERGVTPLGLAIDNGNSAMVALLLKARADPNHPEPTGETPLMRASEVGVLPVVQLLLKHGAVVDVRDANFGQTALMFAARAGHRRHCRGAAGAWRRIPMPRPGSGRRLPSSRPIPCRDSALAWAYCAAECRRIAGVANPRPVA